MNLRTTIFFSVLLVFGAWATYAACEVPSAITFQGFLTDPGGNPVTGSHSAVFTLNDTLELPSHLWSETHQVSFADGYFTVRLGEINPFSPLNFDHQYWLGISLDGGPELAPYIPLTSSPYAIRSKYVDHLTTENVIQFYQAAASMPDADGDGYTKASLGGDDCNDMNPNIHPGAVELCNGIDEDCDGIIDDGAGASCPFPPNAAELGCLNGNCIITQCNLGWQDQNGNFQDGCESQCYWVYVDADCDGWVPGPTQGLDSVCHSGYEGCYTFWPNPNFGDCADTDPGINPGSPELCDGRDNNCDGVTDEGASWECEDGIPCTNDICMGVEGCVHQVQPGHCAINGNCYLDGDPNPVNVCEVCNSELNPIDWTEIECPPGTHCDRELGCIPDKSTTSLEKKGD